MCLFPRSNSNIHSIQYQKGVTSFDCGACPECLKKRSNIWVLRSVYEAKAHAFNCMVTLTYDSFKYDSHGNICGENDVDPSIELSKVHIQLFLKRLRKWWSTISSEPIKYLCAAEYGSHTHRAHYHLLLFGVRFADAHFYKKSKRGNDIYMSKTLTDLWSHGICTIDSINVRSACARYCTKYCSKSRSPGTFMLFSQKLGLYHLRKDFNGLSYWIDGNEFPVPRYVWQDFIWNSYHDTFPWFDFRYRNVPANPFDNLPDSEGYATFEEFRLYLKIKNEKERALYRFVRDNDDLYVRYLDYWHAKSQMFEQHKLDVRTRILQLDNNKYYFYKLRALRALDTKTSAFLAPDSNCGKRTFWSDSGRRFLLSNVGFLGFDVVSNLKRLYDTDFEKFKTEFIKLSEKSQSVADFSRPYTATDTSHVFFYENVLTNSPFWLSVYYDTT